MYQKQAKLQYCQKGFPKSNHIRSPHLQYSMRFANNHPTFETAHVRVSSIYTTTLSAEYFQHVLGNQHIQLYGSKAAIPIKSKIFSRNYEHKIKVIKVLEAQKL